MRMRKYEKALIAFQKSLAANPADTRTKQHLLLAQYAAGQKNKAYKKAKDRIAENPTDLVSNAVLALENDKKTQQFARKFVDFVGEDSFEMTEVSLVFAELGLFDEAERLLAAVCLNAIAQQQRNSLVLYYLAYFAAQKGDESAARTYLGQTPSYYKDGVFPSRPEAVKILKYAVKQNPADPYAHLHLGNVYANLGRIDEALVQWTKAAELDKSLSVAFRNLGLHSWAEKELSEAGRFYIKAINARPGDQTLYRDLALILIENQRPAEAIELLESMPFKGKKRSDITMTLAQTYLDEQRYTEAINLLSSTPYFVNWEGQKTTWLIFNQAHIQRGKNHFSDGNFEAALKDFETALTYPENLGVGRWDEPDEAPAWYWKGKALKQLGRLQQAKSAWKIGAQSHKGSQEQEKYRQLCSTALLTAG
jgi:tetratricopeptide (TPR) repeat protein